MNKENIGSSFDDWLREENIYEEVTAVSVKRVMIREQIKKQKLNDADASEN